MRLPAEKIKEAILDPDREVREAAVFYFADAHSPDPTIMPLVIQAIDQFGLDAFSIYSFDLAQTSDTLAWLMQEIERVGKGSDEREGNYAGSLGRALRQADPELLKQHFATIDSLQNLDSVSKAAIADRIALAALTADELWDELSKFCAAHDNDMLADEDYEHGRSVVTALAPYRDQFEQQVLQCLENPDQCTGWLEVFLVRLAGEMKLEAAISSLTDRLDDVDTIACEEAFRSLEQIGHDTVVGELARRYVDSDWGFRIAAASILEKIHTDFSVQTCLNLLVHKQDELLRGQLLEAVLMNFCSEGIEPARQHVLTAAKSPEMLEVRAALLVACKMLGESFPEFAAWQDDAQHDVEFRRQWYQELYLGQDADEGDFNEDALDDTVLEEDPAFANQQEAPPTTFRRSQRIARNDPCPCGSGKKFKKCCYGKVDSGEETDIDHAAALSSVRPAASPQRYPIGTVALYGPDDTTTTKIVAAVIKREKAEPILERWVGTSISNNPKVRRQIGEFFDRHQVKSVVATEGNLGCPHEEGLDFPSGEDCPFCPYWAGKQSSSQRD
jgi:HEAT repeat protein